MVDRVVASPEALQLLERLQHKHGPDLMFMQSCACCDTSSVYCYKVGEHMVTSHDTLIGHIGGVPYYVDASQNELFKRTQVVIKVVKGDRSGDMSLEGTEGIIFRLETRLFTEAECAELNASEMA